MVAQYLPFSLYNNLTVMMNELWFKKRLGASRLKFYY